MDVAWLLPDADTTESYLSQATGFLRRSSSPGNQPSIRGTVSSCQVDGCTADLTQEEKAYCQKKRICSYHMCAEIIMRPGDSEMYRFCFQCGKLEALSQFDGPKRSCRARLERRKLPPRRSQTWTAGTSAPRTFGTSAAALKQQTANNKQQQQQMLLLELQQQQLQLEKQLLLQQQHQQQQWRMQEASAAMSVDSSAATAAAAAAAAAGAVSPEAMALWQQEQMLVQQKMQMEALRASVAQISAQLVALSPGTPATLTPGRVSYPGFDGFGSGQTSPAASLNGMAGPEYATSALPSAVGAGFYPAVAPRQQQQAQLQSQGSAMGGPSTTAAAAAAALAGNSGWPYNGSAQGSTADGTQTQAMMSRSKSSGAPLNGISNMEIGDGIFDEVDPFSGDDNIHAAVADALNAEFAAAFPGLDLAGHPGSARAHQDTQAMLQQQQHLGTGMAPVAGAGAHQFPAKLPAPVLQQNGFMQAASTSAGGLGFGASAAALQQAQGGPQAGVPEWHQQQLQQLLQTVHVLQNHVQELSLHMHGAPAAPSATAASTESFGGMPSI